MIGLWGSGPLDLKGPLANRKECISGAEGSGQRAVDSELLGRGNIGQCVPRHEFHLGKQFVSSFGE